jgi:glycosyltransferase involved in cell wall biosynthesis
MNILYIDHYAGSEIYGMEYRPYYLAQQWVKQGFKVTIIAASYSHLRIKNPEITGLALYKTEYIDGIKYIWCRTPGYSHNGIKRLINILCFLFLLQLLTISVFRRFITSAAISTKLSIVISSSTYPMDAKAARKISKKYHARFVHEVHDLWPLTLIELAGMNRSHPLIKWMQNMEDFAYKYADKVVSLLPDAKIYMESRGMDSNKFVYIPNGVLESSKNLILPTLHRDLLNSLKEKNMFIVGYAGGMGEANALKSLINASYLVPKEKIAIVLMGDGVCRADLEQQANYNVYFLPAVSKLQVHDFLKKCDCLYIGWQDLPIYKYGISPNKIFDYMLAKKPIIHAIPNGLKSDLVQISQCGLSVLAYNILDIAKAIITMSNMEKTELENLGYNGKKYVELKHSYNKLASDFLSAVMKKNI